MTIKNSQRFLFEYKREQIYWPALLENTFSLVKYSAGFYLPLLVENKRRFRSLFPLAAITSQRCFTGRASQENEVGCRGAQ